MNNVELYRSLVTLAGVMGFGMNLALAVALIQHRADVPHAAATLSGYAILTSLVAAVAVYWRVHDGYVAVPLNVGDFTALVPCVGSLTAGTIAIRQVGRRIGQKAGTP